MSQEPDTLEEADRAYRDSKIGKDTAARAAMRKAEITNLPSEAPADNSLALIRLAIERGLTGDQLTPLYNLHERSQETKARIVFAQDFNTAQGQMVAVVADQKNSHTQSMFAKLEDVQRMAKPVWTRNGFSLSFSEGDILANGMRTVIMTVRHVGGHVETVKGHYPLDGVGAKGGSVMNPLQGTVSSNTYAHRDMMRQYWSIAIGGADMDGNSPSHGISEAQAEELNNLLEKYDSLCLKRGNTQEQCETWHRKFWDFLGCKEGMNDLRAGDFSKAKDRLEKAIKGVSHE